MRLAGIEYARGKRAICIVMPTGSGKTVLGAAFAVRHLIKKPDGHVLWVAHRDELVSQAYDQLTEFGLCCGVIQANPSRPVNPHRSTQIASTQTLLARGLLPAATLFVLDEVHHYASAKWSALALEYRRRGAFIIGLTATPQRADGRGLGDIEDSV